MIMQNAQEKANLQKRKVNASKITKVHVDRNKLRTGKEWRQELIMWRGEYLTLYCPVIHDCAELNGFLSM